jgi:hypothetical protein
MTHLTPIGPAALALAEGRRVVLVFDRPPPRRRRRWPVRWLALLALCLTFGGGCWV